MAIKDIKDKIISDSKIEASKIIDGANNKAREINEKGVQEVKDVKSKIMNKTNQEILLKKGQIITEANLEAKKNILFTKQTIIDGIFDNVLEKIINLDDKQYCNFIKRIILHNIEKGDEIIFINSLDKEKISKDFIQEINCELKAKGKKGDLKLSPSYLQIKGGVVIGSNNIRKNSSLEIIFKKAREKLAIKISRYLFD